MYNLQLNDEDKQLLMQVIDSCNVQGVRNMRKLLELAQRIAEAPEVEKLKESNGN